MRGEELPPVKRNGSDSNKNSVDAVPDHVQQLIEEKKKREAEKKPDGGNDGN